jgi:hypothetical protein
MALREARPFLIGAAVFLGISLWMAWPIGIMLSVLLLIGLLLIHVFTLTLVFHLGLYETLFEFIRNKMAF